MTSHHPAHQAHLQHSKRLVDYFAVCGLSNDPQLGESLTALCQSVSRYMYGQALNRQCPISEPHRSLLTELSGAEDHDALDLYGGDAFFTPAPLQQPPTSPMADEENEDGQGHKPQPEHPQHHRRQSTAGVGGLLGGQHHHQQHQQRQDIMDVTLVFPVCRVNPPL